MSKFLYPIKKLEIMPWIKYYLLNKGEKPSYPLSEIITGASPLTLSNSVRKKFNIFNVGGNTVQNGEPTPETPIPVENVSGEVEVKVENKNLCTNENIGKDSPVLSTLYESYTGAITIAVKTTSGTAQVNYRINYEDGTRYDNYVMTANQANDVWRIAKYTTTKPIKSIGLYYISTGGTRTAEHIMFLKGTYNTITDADYKLHEEQTATFPLAEGQVLHLGDTLEDDGIHQRKFTMVFDGTEDWKAHNTLSSWFYVDNIMNFFTDNNKNDFALCTHFIQEKYSNVLNITNGKFSLGLSSDNINKRAVFKCDDFLTVEEWKAFLAEQYQRGTPVTLESLLATEITISYTAEQQIAYNNLKNLYSYKGTTHISSSNAPSPVFEVQYYMEGE